MMHGYQPIEKEAVLWSNSKNRQYLRGLFTAMATGAIAGFAVTFLRLNLGLPGHKALFWMIPVITVRLTGGCKLGTTAGAFGVSLTTFALGGHLAGGFLGFGLIILGGLFLDIIMNFLEQISLPNWSYILLLATTTMFCNLICLIKKLFMPNGMGLHMLFTHSGFWFRFASYAFFGFISGLIAWLISSCIHKYR